MLNHNYRNLNIHSTICDLPLHDCIVALTCTGEVVAQKFEQYSELPGVIVLNGEKVVGLLSRRKFLENVGRPFGVDIYMKRPIKVLMDKISSDVLILDETCSISDACQSALGRRPECAYDPLIVRRHDGALRLLDLNPLLLAQSQLLSLSISIVQQQKEMSESLRSAWGDFSASLELQPVLDGILQHLDDLIVHDSAAIYLLEDDVLGVKATKDTPATPGALPPASPVNDDLFGAVQRAMNPVIINNTATDPRYVGEEGPGGGHSWMGVPLVSHGQLIGLLVIEAHKPGSFSEEIAALAHIYANQASLTIQNASMYQSETQRVREMEALYRATTSLVSTLEFQTLLERILSSALDAVPNICSGTLYIVDSETGRLSPGAVQGGDEPNPAPAGLPGEIEWVRNAIEQRKPVVLLENPGANTIIVVPLIHEMDVLGALYLHAAPKARFTQYDKWLLEIFGSTATAAIRNAQLHMEVQKLAQTDSITGLLNRRGFYQMATHEVDRANRFKRPLSAMMVDIDFFKRVNDTFGHVTGDRVIQQVGKKCRELMRSVDLVCRFGGEEFAILLPETDLAGARIVAERLRQGIADLAVDADGASVCVTVSIGVAEYDCCGRDLERTLEILLNRTDMALYASKMIGRNRVCEWDDSLDQLQNIPAAGDGSFRVTLLAEKLQQREEELRQVQASRRAVEDHLSSILQNASEAIITTDHMGCILVFNQSAEEIFEYKASEILGERLERLLPGQIEMLFKVEQGRLVEPSVGRKTLIGHRKNGSMFPLEASASGTSLNGSKVYTVILTDITERRQAEEQIQETNQELSEAYDKTIQGWADALELRDLETRGHSERVVQLTVEFARWLGICEEELVPIRRGALLHDIGKIGIPDSILQKPGPLTPEEWTVMKQHPVFAYSLLSPIRFLAPALDIPHYHHEHWDGSGYPDGLKGHEIPLAARIFTIVDVWDALRSRRSYRQAWSDGDAREYLQQQAGKQFDPDLVKQFFHLLGALGSAGNLEVARRSHRRQLKPFASQTHSLDAFHHPPPVSHPVE
ncbi:MAG: diguanylate cyclase [Anaerolineaceae bacterium]|nr:diguanylate cyclase [Anaerolineaceae bacterium]